MQKWGSRTMSNAINNVLIIDVEGDDVQIVEGMLSEDFDVTVCNTPGNAIDAVNQSIPGVILLNPAMENLDTLSIITTAKSLNPKSHVIFLSDLTSIDDSILAYEQGADDFIPKPYNPIELYCKIENHVKEASDRAQLAHNADSARSAAFAAMESNSEMGIILRYMEEITSCNSYSDLGFSLAQTVQSFGVNATVQIRGINKVFNVGCENDSFEANLLSKSVEKGKIIEGAHKLIINDRRISLLIKNTPAKDDPKYGRIKDNIAMMISATGARVITIDLVTQLELQRESGLNSIIGNARSSMHNIRGTFNIYEKNIWSKIQAYREHTESVLVTLGLSEEQEDTLMESLDQFVQQVIETDETKDLIESSFTNLLAELDKLS